MTDLIENYNTQYEKKKLGMWLDLTTYCNAKCPQCHRTNSDGLEKTDWLPLVQWSFEEFKDMFPLKTLEHINNFDICGTWGDPIMNKDIFKIVKYIIENSSANVLINTNGSFRNPDWWWDLGLIGGKRITVMWAIEGITQEQHSLYRQDTSLELILENMETFSLAGGLTQVFTVTFKHNEKDLYNIAKLVKDHGAEDIFFVQSNRFYENNKFKFIDKSGMEKFLEKTTLENSDFYWTLLNLYNEEHMKRIYDESN
jgi:MoaA/NifB/PqqE/SkfB family radical SAM enzyme